MDWLDPTCTEVGVVSCCSIDVGVVNSCLDDLVVVLRPFEVVGPYNSANYTLETYFSNMDANLQVSINPFLTRSQSPKVSTNLSLMK